MIDCPLARAQLGTFGIDCPRRSCVLEPFEIVDWVAIAAPVLSRSLVRACPSVHLIDHDSCLPHALLHVLENLLGTAGWSPAALAAEA